MILENVGNFFKLEYGSLVNLQLDDTTFARLTKWASRANLSQRNFSGCSIVVRLVN